MSFGFRGPRPPYYRPRFGVGGNGGGPRPPWGFQPRMSFRAVNPMFAEDNFDNQSPFQGGDFPDCGPGLGPNGGPGMGPNCPPMQPNNPSPEDVLAWLDKQHPVEIRRVMYHCRWLLEQMNFPLEDAGFGGQNNPEEEEEEEQQQQQQEMNSWYDDNGGEPVAKRMQGNISNNKVGGANNKKPKHPGLGFSKNTPGNSSGGQMQWTPAGWVPKDNKHKITSTMRPMPVPTIIPPPSITHKEAGIDKDKLKMLENNVSMMTCELTKICKRFNIQSLNKEDLSGYPEHQQGKLKTAIQCVANAEKTLSDFRTFLKEDKYKEWNEEQQKLRDEKVKQMIGDTPKGVPHKRPGSEQTNDNQESGCEEDVNTTSAE